MSDRYAGVDRDAPHLRGRALFGQDWRDLVFLHWPVDPVAVAGWLPPGTRPDLWHDGATYVGMVPFRMRRAGFGRRTAVPFFGSFLEWNVRLYSVDDDGRHGVVFRSLDATRLAVVLAARLGRVPYRYAAIEVTDTADCATWTMHRREAPKPTSRLVLRKESPVAPTDLEVFLTSRWGMHSTFAGRLVWVPNEHGAWPLHDASVLDLADELVAAAGIRPVGPMLRPLWTPGVRTHFGRPQLVRQLS